MSESLDSAIAEKVRKNSKAQSLMGTFGASLDILEHGRTVISADVSEGVRQQHGFAHAALTFAIGDSAAGYAALTLLPLESEVLTAEMKINLLAPGAGRLVAEGRVLKPGRRLIVVASDVWSEDGGQRRHIAALQGTMIPAQTPDL